MADRTAFDIITFENDSQAPAAHCRTWCPPNARHCGRASPPGVRRLVAVAIRALSGCRFDRCNPRPVTVAKAVPNPRPSVPCRVDVAPACTRVFIVNLPAIGR
jgi:hypothetical protein